MRIYCAFILFSLVFVAGCTDLGDTPPLIEVDERLVLLKKVLNGPLAKPEGKLKSESFYYGPNTLQYRTDFYYDSQGRELLKIQIQNEDTTGVFLHEYLTNEKLDQTGVYSKRPEGFVFAHYFKRFYKNNDQTINVMIGRDGNFSQHEQYKLDQLGRKISYRKGTETTFSLYRFIFENEQSNNISEEHYLESEHGEPLYRYHYDYNETGLLKAKIISFTSTKGDRAEFEYFYDKKGRISEELKNDIRFFSGAIERKTFEYY